MGVIRWGDAGHLVNSICMVIISTMNSKRTQSRRNFLMIVGGGLVAVAASIYTFRTKLVNVFMVSRIKNDPLPTRGPSFLDSDACVVTPKSIEGPYYIDEDYVHGVGVRSDLRDGQPGTDLKLKFKVVNANGCQPMSGVAVDIWSCDASGHYSGYANNDPNQFPFSVATSNNAHVPANSPERFLRGRQVTDNDGFVEFLTIFPGWYSPRTVHIHILVTDASNRIALSQMYFPQEIINEIHTSGAYVARGLGFYTNANDIVINESVGAGFPKMVKEGNGYSGTLTIGVNHV